VAVTKPETKPKVDIIWNITRVCPWDCAQCCVDAYHVTARGGVANIAYGGLSSTITTPRRGQLFDDAAAELSRLGLEITLDEKLAVLDHLDGFDAEIDFSGGDPLVVTENLEVIRHASATLGRGNVSITATGAGMARYDAALLARYIHQIEFTYDGAGDDLGRPRGYNRSNLAKAREFRRYGCATKAQAPLTPLNVRPESLRRLYLNLHEAEIDTLLVMRTFPVGRGVRTSGEPALGADDYRAAIGVLRDMEATYGAPRIRLQCALRHLEGAHGENPCDLLRESFGITNDGRLQLSAWAWDERGRPFEDWILGDLRRQSLREILDAPRARSLRARLDENFGHCKIFAYRFSSPRTADSMFHNTDPLYVVAPSALATAPPVLASVAS
jgi:MoaA/NifB/PqqE/SkfB family radical SAM enzyme